MCGLTRGRVKLRPRGVEWLIEAKGCATEGDVVDHTEYVDKCIINP